MIEGITKEELREDVGNSKLHPDTDSRDARIFRALRLITDEGTVFYVLADTPDQFEDAFNILVDDKMIVGFELARNDPDALPTEIDRYSIEEYQAIIADDFTEAKFRIALELARRDLAH